jgi:hypothetical protein
VKELALPVTIVLALLANAVMYGTDRGRSAQRLDGIEASNAEIKSGVNAVRADVAAVARQQLEAQVDQRDIRRQLDGLNRDLLLLKDYTEGRIAHLPYRKGR